MLSCMVEDIEALKKKIRWEWVQTVGYCRSCWVLLQETCFVADIEALEEDQVGKRLCNALLLLVDCSRAAQKRVLQATA